MNDYRDMSEAHIIETAEQSNHTQIGWWRSRLLWRLVASVFFAVICVQVILSLIYVGEYRKSVELKVQNNARIAISALFGARDDVHQDDIISRKDAAYLRRNSWITGIELRDKAGKIIQTYGESIELLAEESYFKPKMNEEWTRYEFVYRDLYGARPYGIFVRVDAGASKIFSIDFVSNTLYLLVALSVFITLFLSIVISRTLITPISRLRTNLLSAAQDPENAEKYVTHFDGKDEISVIANAANDLIYENAQNLRHMKNQAKDTIHQLAYYDSLTGLPNRGLYLQELERALDNAKKDQKVVVTVIDLDHFKDINDTMGHQAGDYLLTAIGKRLNEFLVPPFYVARSGADEFSAFVTLDEDQDIETNVVDKILESMKDTFELKGQEILMKISLGVSCFPEDGDEAGILLKNSDIALARAKSEGRDTVCYYSSDLQQDIQERFTLKSALRQALDKDELELFYQPQLDTRTMEIIGAEALIRWFRYDVEKEEKVFVSPAEFIPIAEESGLIIPIGEWVLRQACRQCRNWHEAEYGNIAVAVNISAIQFQQPNFVKMVEEVLQETGLDPQYLELELTESVFAIDIQKSISTLQALKELGVSLSIDDFGTGYSCLSYLSKFPIDRLKIDQSFVRNALTNREDSAIIKTIIKLTQSLSLDVIAEGVETVEHEIFLKAQECHHVQGYHYARPMGIYDFLQFVENHGTEAPKKNKK